MAAGRAGPRADRAAAHAGKGAVGQAVGQAVAAAMGGARRVAASAAPRYADARWEAVDSLVVRWVNGHVTLVGGNTRRGGYVRALGRGWAGSSFAGLGAAAAAGRDAAACARLQAGPRLPLATVPGCCGDGPEGGAAPAGASSPAARDFGCGLNRGLDLAPRLALVERYGRLVSGHRLVSLAMVELLEVAWTKWHASSETPLVRQSGTQALIQFSAYVEGDGRVEDAHEHCGGGGGLEDLLGLEARAEGVARRAVDSLTAAPIVAGAYTVVLDPQLAGVFIHEAFGHLSEGDAAAEGLGAEAPCPGATVGPPALNIVDDPGYPKGPGGYLFDDEGTPGRRTFLVRDGVAASRLHSRTTAAQAGEPPTGHARALDFRHPPLVRMSNTLVLPAGPDPADLIGEVRRGIYARRARGGAASAGRFSITAAEAFAIEGGRVGRRLRNVNIAGSTLAALRSISAIAGDTELSPFYCDKEGQFPLLVGVGGPHVRMEGASAATTA